MMLGKQITLNDMESVVSDRLPPGSSRDHVVITAVSVGVAIQCE